MIVSEVRQSTDDVTSAGVSASALCRQQIGSVQLRTPANLKDKVSNGTGSLVLLRWLDMASYDYGKTEIVNYICQHFAPGSICLDVGACDGKWANLLNQHLVMDAVEIWQPNIIEWRLDSKYRKVFNVDVADLEYQWYDLIIFGDVIEHMTVERAQRVINYARGRCRDMIIGVPYQYPQDEIYGNPYEKHIQPDLTDEVFQERYPGFELLCRPMPRYAYYHIGDANG